MTECFLIQPEINSVQIIRCTKKLVCSLNFFIELFYSVIPHAKQPNPDTSIDCNKDPKVSGNASQIVLHPVSVVRNWKSSNGID